MLFPQSRDQRRSERRWIAIPVQIRVGKALIEGTTLNLSDHGMYLFTAANIALGSDIEIEFRPPEEKSVVRLCATVRRKVVYLYGIEFLNNLNQAGEGQGSTTDRRRTEDRTPPWQSQDGAS